MTEASRVHQPGGLEAPEMLAARLAAIVDSSDDAIVSKDLDGTVRTWNKGAERLFGYTMEEAVGRSIRLIVPGDRQQEEDDVLARLSLGERIDHFETVRRRKDGSFIDISLTVSPIRDSTGRVVGASKIARDISERKRAEEALRQSVAIKDQFLSLVSHELRTPIAIIVGNGQLLLKRGESLTAEERAQSLADLTAEADRLQRIIENLLILTRVEVQDDFPLEFIKLERLAEDVVSSFERRSPHRCVLLNVEGAIPTVAGEGSITRMLLENLLSNADKYSPKDQPIEVCIRAAGETAVEVHVLDRGFGLTAEDQRSIFDPFYRSREAREAAGGMGLGLAVCRKIIEAQHGTIEGRPRSGGGSDFCFTLPIAPDPDE